MATEITASILIGPVDRESTHGQPTGTPGRRLFASSHVLVLMENSRATWIMQHCPELGGTKASRRIQPASPQHLLAAAVLGYTALAKPEALQSADRLAALVAAEPRGTTLDVGLIDDELARRIYDHCSEHLYAVVTSLPGTTIDDGELRMASGAGFLVAVPGPA